MNNWERFKELSSEDLIHFVQNKEFKEKDRDDAFLTLCFRFRESLCNECIKLCKNLGHDIDVGYTIAENSFKKFYRYNSFKMNEGKYSVDDSFKVYLLKIAKNELKDYYHREQKKLNGQLYDGTEKIITEIPNVDVSKLSKELKIIHDVVLSLPYSHQVIYFTYKVHEKLGVNLPKTLRQSLREHLGGISQATVRYYKKEAIDKIEGVKSIIDKIKI